MSQVKSLKIDREVAGLFKHLMTIDGALYPDRRVGLKSCCKKKDGTCYTASEAEKMNGCYNKEGFSDYRHIINKMGIKIGAGPYTDGMAESIDKKRKAGKHIRVIRTSNDLDRAFRAKEYGSVLYIQTWKEQHFQMGPKELARHFFRNGGRIVQPAYNAEKNGDLKTYFAGGADEDDAPLSRSGITLVRELMDRYVLLDVSHVGRKSALDIIRLGKLKNRPVTANHANAIGVFDDRDGSSDCSSGCKSRNHDDEVICGIAQTGGVVGITPIRFMFKSWDGASGQDASENDFIEHLDYVAKRLRCKSGRGKKVRYLDMTHHVGLSSDGSTNGYDPKVGWLHMEMANRLNRWQRIATRLKQECGYSIKEIERIIGGNFERVYREALPGVQRPKIVSPRNGVVRSKGVVLFKWKRPTVNQPKPKKAFEWLAKPKQFRIVIERKVNGAFKHFKSEESGSALKKRVRLPGGKYRWFVKAKRGDLKVNSHWAYFEVR